MDSNKKNNPDLIGNDDQDICASNPAIPMMAQEIDQYDKQPMINIAECQVRIYANSLAECITPQRCHVCGHSIPYGNTNFCKHPLLVQSLVNSST